MLQQWQSIKPTILCITHHSFLLEAFGSDHCQKAAGFLVFQTSFPLCACENGHPYLASKKECEGIKHSKVWGGMDKCQTVWDPIAKLHSATRGNHRWEQLNTSKVVKCTENDESNLTTCTYLQICSTARYGLLSYHSLFSAIQILRVGYVMPT